MLYLCMPHMMRVFIRRRRTFGPESILHLLVASLSLSGSAFISLGMSSFRTRDLCKPSAILYPPIATHACICCVQCANNINKAYKLCRRYSRYMRPACARMKILGQQHKSILAFIERTTRICWRHEKWMSTSRASCHANREELSELWDLLYGRPSGRGGVEERVGSARIVIYGEPT